MTDTASRLTHHSGALRALGRELLADDGELDDLVQDTYLAALRRPPEPRDGSGPWLLEVARNLAHRSSRTARRNSKRKTAGASSASRRVAKLLEQLRDEPGERVRGRNPDFLV